MNPFPESYELIGFFESEPEITDRDVPWFYNRLTFNYAVGLDSIVCAIEPGYGQIDLTWRRDGTELASFALRRISSLEVSGAPGDEFLIAKFDSTNSRDFVLVTKPSVRIEWGNLDHEET